MKIHTKIHHIFCLFLSFPSSHRWLIWAWFHSENKKNRWISINKAIEWLSVSEHVHDFYLNFERVIHSLFLEKKKKERLNYRQLFRGCLNVILYLFWGLLASSPPPPPFNITQIYVTIIALCAFTYILVQNMLTNKHTFVQAYKNCQCQAVTSLSLKLFCN